MKRLIAFISILMLLAPVVLAGTATISIFGTNATNAQTNMTNTGNQSVNVSAWAVGSAVKNFSVNVTNATDTLTFNLYNITVGQIVELRVNGTVINGYQANSSGAIRFNYTQPRSNVSYRIQPALNTGGYNQTWLWLTNLTFRDGTTQSSAPITSQNKTTGRAPNTVYQNTNVTARFVSISYYRTGGVGFCQFLTDSFNPPTTVVFYDAAADYDSVMGIVLPGNYYEFDESLANSCQSPHTSWMEFN